MTDEECSLKTGRRHSAKTHGFRAGGPVPEEVSFDQNPSRFSSRISFAEVLSKAIWTFNGAFLQQLNTKIESLHSSMNYPP